MNQRNDRFLVLPRNRLGRVAIACSLVLFLAALNAAFGGRIQALSSGGLASANSNESSFSNDPSLTTAAVSVGVMNFSFSPNAFAVQSGEQVTVTVFNSGPAPHTFTINGVTDTGQIAPGSSKTAQFVAGQPGTLTFYCTIHGQSVMSGQITVRPTSTTAPPSTAPAQPSAPTSPAPQQQQPQAPARPAAPAQMRPPSTGDGGLLAN